MVVILTPIVLMVVGIPGRSFRLTFFLVQIRVLAREFSSCFLFAWMVQQVSQLQNVFLFGKMLDVDNMFHL